MTQARSTTGFGCASAPWKEALTLRGWARSRSKGTRGRAACSSTRAIRRRRASRNPFTSFWAVSWVVQPNRGEVPGAAHWGESPGPHAWAWKHAAGIIHGQGVGTKIQYMAND